MDSKEEEVIVEDFTEYGQCCFCNNFCNPSSQTCGRCARESFQQNKRRKYLIDVSE